MVARRSDFVDADKAAGIGPGETAEAVASTILDQIEDGDADKVIRVGRVAELVGVSVSEVRRRWAIEGDTLPKPFGLGGSGPKRRVGVLEADVRRWIRNRVNAVLIAVKIRYLLDQKVNTTTGRLPFRSIP